MKISWLDLSDRIKYELQQLEEEGNDVSELREEWNELEGSNLNDENKKVIAENFYNKLEEVQFSVENEKNEPSDWNEIIQLINIETGNRSIIFFCIY
ncbi:MAG: hypothetical protein MZV64_14155 [Ignavibacteriales bacterium]|nr:hypothetical protein [Ignavibacteriales bacterium]